MNYSKDKNDNLTSTTQSAVLNPEESENRLTEIAGIVIDRKGGPVAGLLVELYAGSEARGTPVSTVTTDIDGSYLLLHSGKADVYSVKVALPLPAGATSVTPDPAVISRKVAGVVAAGIFVIH